MWFKIQDQQVKLQIIAKPKAKKTAILKVTEQGLHIAIQATPHKGEANEELILFLSNIFKVPKTKIMIKTGEGSKYKQVMMPLTDAVQKSLDDLTALHPIYR